MMAGHLLHSGGEGGIGEERHKLRSETCVSYWTRLADSLIVTGIQGWYKEWRQHRGNRNNPAKKEFESVCSEPTGLQSELSLQDHPRVSRCASHTHLFWCSHHCFYSSCFIFRAARGCRGRHCGLTVGRSPSGGCVSSSCLGGLPLGPLASSHSPKKHDLG